MNDPKKWLDKKLNRLDFLAALFDNYGFTQIALEIRSLRTETEIKNFFNALKGWLF